VVVGTHSLLQPLLKLGPVRQRGEVAACGAHRGRHLDPAPGTARSTAVGQRL